MPLVFRYSDPGGAEEPAVMVDLGNTVTGVRLGTLALAQAAELGEVAMSGIEIEDPDGTLDLVGLRGFRVEETSAPSNSRWIFNGPIGDQRIRRGDSQRPSIRLGAARVWSIDLADQNWSLGVSIITGSDGNRPAETAGERLRWVIANYSRVKDYGHVTYPTTAMDACDYRHQTVKDVIADCALAGTAAYNYWADRFEAQNRAELFFMLPTSSSYASTISISNVYADVNSTTVFAPAIEAELYRSPSRITYGVDLQYDGGSVYVTNPTTGAQYAYVDQSAPMANVKSSTKATTIANRFLSENDEQDERVTVSIKVPAAQVNDVRHGHRMNGVKFSHLPGWEAGRDCRVLRRTVIQEESGGEAWYRLDLELSPVSTSVLSCSAAIAAKVSNTANGLETSPTAAVSVTAPADGYVVTCLFGENGNTPGASGMNVPSGYTTLDNRSSGRFTEFIGYKAATAGSMSASASFTPGFASSGVWAAGIAYLPWASVTLVQETDSGASVGPTFASNPTAGNTILMFALTDRASASTPGGATGGPTTGWTELFSVITPLVSSNCRANLTCWARCVETGDGKVYDWTPNGAVGLMGEFTYVVELATS